MRILFVLVLLFGGLLLPPTSDEPKKASVPFFPGLGKHTRKVTTKHEQAQKYFDQGLNFLYAFNHDEAIRSFQQAAELDPQCAMAHWGVALANGPHINNPAMPPERNKAAWEALAKARTHQEQGTPAEKALIAALGKRYADPAPADRKALDEAYATAMRSVWQQFPHDADVGALFAEAMMDLRPWDLWTAEGTPQPGTPEIVATLEAVMAVNPEHPLALHLYIHAVEASPNPEKADAPADRLRHLAPGLGHLVHMPSHIDIRRGRWQEAVAANQRALEADRKYREMSPQQGFYRVYMAHNHHMLAFAALMQGESKRSLEAVRAMLAGVPKQVLEDKEQAAMIDGFFAIPLEVLLRFGRWEEVLQEPEPPATLPVTRALRHYARGVAFAAQGKTAEARVAQKTFREAAAQTPQEARMGNNPAADIFAVAEAVLEGEILFREGKAEESLTALRQAIQKEDRLRYDEPPDWGMPVRHVLGATLMQMGRAAEAEQVYREDLRRWPANGWSLFGLAQSLESQNKTVDAAQIKAQFDKVWQRADVKLNSSCFCQPGLKREEK
jgi:tetratricopeptide (TPR) repeat protein